MAYRRTRNSGRSYASRRAPARSTRRAPVRRRRTASRVTSNTLRLVIEQIPAGAVSRNIGPFVTTAPAKSTKAKF